MTRSWIFIAIEARGELLVISNRHWNQLDPVLKEMI